MQLQGYRSASPPPSSPSSSIEEGAKEGENLQRRTEGTVSKSLVCVFQCVFNSYLYTHEDQVYIAFDVVPLIQILIKGTTVTNNSYITLY